MTAIEVLLVDDHPVAREGVCRMLDPEPGIKVAGESGGAEEALSWLNHHAVDVILMDVRMPEIDGIEATRQLKDMRPELKVIMLSAFGGEYLAEAIEAGADGYMLKSASRAQLVDAIVQVTEGQSPIDASLTGGLFDRFAKVSKLAREKGLSNRQMEVLQLIAAGLSSKEMAASLAISEATLKRDVKGILEYLGVKDRAQAIAEAYQRHLL